MNISYAAVTDSLQVAAYINKQPVAAKEFRREMLRYRAEIYGQFAKTHQSSEAGNFWNTAFNGVKPIDSLRSRALKALIVLKVQEQLLTRHKLWPYKNYNQLLEALHKTNIDRNNAVQKNEVIYGPVNYTEQDFYDYQFSNAIIRLKKAFRDSGVIKVNDSLLSAHFNQLKSKGIYSGKQSFDKVKNSVADNYTEQRYQHFIDSLVSKAQVQKVPAVYNKLVF
ncbi:hypothetical protein FW774_06775 [Pedobacter sp. BS3]|uniref:hypothetical protein n=1 Tax=Pedobacter sp. BS3 TaxID=2567937 RepID=UPI0011EC9A3E|nr:hypothetical protein [Pedobacter sp. BS3]TZF84680.1 hypothetical protein FW774_06775 [Pedobacter sp. BS3]